MFLSLSLSVFFNRRENFTPNSNSRLCSWHFPAGNAAGPRERLLKCPILLSHTLQRRKRIAPTGAEDGGTDLVVLEVENDMPKEENEKKQLEKQKLSCFSLPILT